MRLRAHLLTYTLSEDRYSPLQEGRSEKCQRQIPSQAIISSNRLQARFRVRCVWPLQMGQTCLEPTRPWHPNTEETTKTRTGSDTPVFQNSAKAAVVTSGVTELVRHPPQTTAKWSSDTTTHKSGREHFPRLKSQECSTKIHIYSRQPCSSTSGIWVHL